MASNVESTLMKFYPMFPLFSSWSEDHLTPKDIGAAMLTSLARLTPLCPATRNWLLLKGPSFEYIPIAKAEEVIEEIVESNAEWTADWAPGVGYTVLAKGSKIPSDFGASDSIHISVTAGGRVNEFEFEVGDMTQPNDFDLITYPVYSGALRTLATIWPCPWALAKVYLPDDSFRPSSVFDIAWIAYLSAPLAAGLAAPPELLAEATPGGGIILSVVQTRIDPSNPEHVRRSALLSAIML